MRAHTHILLCGLGAGPTAKIKVLPRLPRRCFELWFLNVFQNRLCRQADGRLETDRNTEHFLVTSDPLGNVINKWIFHPTRLLLDSPFHSAWQELQICSTPLTATSAHHRARKLKLLQILNVCTSIQIHRMNILGHKEKLVGLHTFIKYNQIFQNSQQQTQISPS